MTASLAGTLVALLAMLATLAHYSLLAVGVLTVLSYAHWFVAGLLDRRNVARLMDDYRRRVAELDERPAR